MSIPKLDHEDFQALLGMNYEQRAVKIMNCYLEEFTQQELSEFAAKAYRYGEKFDHKDVAPIVTVGENTHILELWHGPTCAFKDMALQMLPYLLTASLKKTGETKSVLILVATSGDTGKAALEGFCDVDHTKILVFYPRNGVSSVQELQMTTQSGENVGVCAVEGNFDDAQTGVKAIFSDEALREELAQQGYFLSSANSINWGRVLPQIVYYISAYCDLLSSGKIKMGQRVNCCVPTGNFGNILAAFYAKQMGLPLGKLLCASNRNNVLTQFLKTGVYDRNRPFYNTPSPSMDILISSNLERLLYLLTGSDEEVGGYMQSLAKTGRYEVSQTLKKRMQSEFACGDCDNEETLATIRRVYDKTGYLMDTHTAVGYHVLEGYRAQTGDDAPAILASTASPFKFCDSVLTALGQTKLAQGLDLIDQLEQVSGVKAPHPLASLRGKAVRFDEVTEKEDMQSVVRAMLR